MNFFVPVLPCEGYSSVLGPWLIIETSTGRVIEPNLPSYDAALERCMELQSETPAPR